MMKWSPVRWRSLAIKTAIFVAVIIMLEIAFTKTTIPSSLKILPKPAFGKAYPLPPTDIEIRPGAISMMIVGDSLSQGGEGDWTWRYRLWEWFRREEVMVDFVGPFLGTRPQAVPALNTETLPEPVGIPPVGEAVISTAVSSFCKIICPASWIFCLNFPILSPHNVHLKQRQPILKRDQS
jgi:hypothetical protein